MLFEINMPWCDADVRFEISYDELNRVLSHREADASPNSLHQSDVRSASAIVTALERELEGRTLSEALAAAVQKYGATVVAVMAQAKKAETDTDTDTP